MSVRILPIAFLVALGACADHRAASMAEDGRRQSGAELSAIYPGGPYDGTGADGAAFTVVAKADRTATMELASGRTDSGRWRIEGDHVCFTWTWVGEGKERCGHIYRRADGRYRSVDPSGNLILTFSRR